MTWFESLTGFDERSPDLVRKNITVDDEILTSHINGNTLTCGKLEIPSLAELRGQIPTAGGGAGLLSVREVVANVQDLHRDASNAGALFQVASQFNLLEMASPNVTPEQGVGIYEYDRTQGPACAIAAGAGTIYRNYFAPVNGQTGQSVNNQIDCLAGLGAALDNSKNRLWEMRNGYALASENGLREISHRLHAASENERDELRKLIRVGIQRDTQVTLKGATHKVTQVYCSALPVAYSEHPSGLWEDFARLVLEAAYEATLCAAILNARRTGNTNLYLTLLGGGAFGNKNHWITDAILRALKLYRDWDIRASIVSYGTSKDYVRQLAAEFQEPSGRPSP
jgi:hypothetical protein